MEKAKTQPNQQEEFDESQSEIRDLLGEINDILKD
jgi:hypothetical protein|tara:strand:- start:360 stop:464 length:105 start_codon:yes stop_codon:yes gene_type:complete